MRNRMTQRLREMKNMTAASNEALLIATMECEAASSIEGETKSEDDLARGYDVAKCIEHSYTSAEGRYDRTSFGNTSYMLDVLHYLFEGGPMEHFQGANGAPPPCEHPKN